MASNKEKDKITGVETTGHEWDGLKEFNNPAPRWWLWVFFITVIWSVGYWVVYPAWPIISGHTKGKWGWTEYSQLDESTAEIKAIKASYMQKFEGKSLQDIDGDQELREFAIAGGSAMFKDNCATCHGTGASGGKGYPNLNDDDWLWGGTLEDIYTTIRYGIRSGHEQARDSMMTAFGKDGILTKEQISDVADYVLTLGNGGDTSLPGAAIFAENCAVCHGNNGEGNRSMGAPKLNDQIWLYGGTKDDIVYTVTNARKGVMPSWVSRLDDNTIKQLAVYVHSLGGGE